MEIFFTFDYELFFGEKSGTPEKCLLSPSSQLIKIAERTGARFTFFIDSGYIKKLNEYRNKFSQLEKDYDNIRTQLDGLLNSGHDLQLHIHHHWEDSNYDGTNWVMNTARYKLADFSDTEAEEIFESCYNELKKYCSPPMAFRAGGWCIQPFPKFKTSFKKFGIIYDSSVYKGGTRTSTEYNFDFRSAPDKTSWQFEDDPLIEKSGGSFTEMAMSAQMLSPLFFWKLFLLGRMNPEKHKYVGDGIPVGVKGYRKEILTRNTLHCASVDGYFASQIETALNQTKKKNNGNEFVILGHPKALTKYSLRKLESVILKLKNKNSITTFSKYHSEKEKK